MKQKIQIVAVSILFLVINASMACLAQAQAPGPSGVRQTDRLDIYAQTSAGPSEEQSLGSEEKGSMEKGMALYYQKKWEEALPHFKAVAKEEPGNTLNLIYYLMTGVNLGKLETMIDRLEDDLSEDPKNMVAQTQLGLAYYAKSLRKGKSFRDEAVLELKQASRLGRLSSIHTGLGILYLDKGLVNRAKREFKRAIEINPKDAVAYEYLGQIAHFEEKSPEEATRRFKKVIELLPTYPDAYYYLGRVAEEKGDLDEGVTNYKKTMELDPLGVGRGYFVPQVLGDIYFKQKKYGEAAEAFRLALKINPDNVIAKQKLERAEKQAK